MKANAMRLPSFFGYNGDLTSRQAGSIGGQIEAGKKHSNVFLRGIFFALMRQKSLQYFILHRLLWLLLHKNLLS